MTGPERDELLEGLAGAERDRLEAVHARLVAAGAPPELPPGLTRPPAPPSARVVRFPRRYRYTALAAAASFAIAVFGVGYVVGGARAPDEPLRSVAMTGEGATATLAVFAADAAGNWPMRLTATGLPVLPRGEQYELWLTRDGELAEPCGTFVVENTETEVRLNAPYRLRDFTGWVVTRSDDPTFVLRTPTV